MTHSARLVPGDLRRDDRVRAIALPSGQVVAADVALALGFVGRLRGLIGSQPLALGQGLLLRPCNGIHTWLMSYPIDVAFLCDDGHVVATYAALPPWRITRVHAAACCVLELAAHALAQAGVEVFSQVLFEPTPQETLP